MYRRNYASKNNVVYAEGHALGQKRQFHPGEKAPNNGIYVEVGDTGSNVVNPKQIKLAKGDRFPENSNDERIWTYKRKQ